MDLVGYPERIHCATVFDLRNSIFHCLRGVNQPHPSLGLVPACTMRDNSGLIQFKIYTQVDFLLLFQVK